MTLSTILTPESRPAPDLARPNKVWAQLAELFGKAFYREHGEFPGSLWQQAISRLTDQQLSIGLANLGNDGLQFPPNLSMFIEACKRQAPVRQLGVKLLPLTVDQQQKDAEKAWADMERLAGKKLDRA